MMAAIICATCGWVWVVQCQPLLLVIVHTLKHKEKHLVSKKSKRENKKCTNSANNGCHHSHPHSVEDHHLGLFPALVRLEWGNGDGRCQV